MPTAGTERSYSSASASHKLALPAVIVLDRDPPARIRFEVKARNDYFDMAPIRRLYRRRAAAGPL
jgi:hypothetical protein